MTVNALGMGILACTSLEWRGANIFFHQFMVTLLYPYNNGLSAQNPSNPWRTGFQHTVIAALHVHHIHTASCSNAAPIDTLRAMPQA